MGRRREGDIQVAVRMVARQTGRELSAGKDGYRRALFTIKYRCGFVTDEQAIEYARRAAAEQEKQRCKQPKPQSWQWPVWSQPGS